MTKISYIHGIPADEQVQRGQEIGPAPFLTPFGLTDGQFGAILLHRQLDLLAKFYPEKKDYSVSRASVSEALRKGVHGANLNSGGSDLVRSVNYQLANFGLKRRATITGTRLTDELIEYYLNGGTGNLYNNDSHYKDRCLEAYNEANGTNYSSYGFSSSRRQRIHTFCSEQVDTIAQFNSQIDKSSHHLLYNWAPLGTGSVELRTKRQLHLNAVDGFARVIDTSRSNMAMWMRTGVMATNATEGAGMLTPEATNQALSEYWSNGGEVGVNAVPVVVLIISAVTAAIGATTQLIVSLGQQKQMQIQASAQGIGGQNFGPNQGDYYGQGGGPSDQFGEENQIQQYLPYGLAAAGLYLLTND